MTDEEFMFCDVCSINKQDHRKATDTPKWASRACEQLRDDLELVPAVPHDWNPSESIKFEQYWGLWVQECRTKGNIRRPGVR